MKQPFCCFRALMSWCEGVSIHFSSILHGTLVGAGSLWPPLLCNLKLTLTTIRHGFNYNPCPMNHLPILLFTVTTRLIYMLALSLLLAFAYPGKDIVFRFIIEY
jgi:hypothetical protein